MLVINEYDQDLFPFSFLNTIQEQLLHTPKMLVDDLYFTWEDIHESELQT